MSARSWVFTINNPTVDDLLMMVENHDTDYICFGFEKGSEKGTEHIQGYLQYRDGTRTAQHIHKFLPRAWHEPARGNCESNQIYTKKQGDWYEFGTPQKQGKRNDLIKYIEDVKNGKKDKELLRDSPHQFLAYAKYTRRLRELCKEDTDKELNVIYSKDRYRYMDKCRKDGLSICMETEHYDGESILLLEVYHISDYKWIEDWLHKYPLTIKRGYEIIRVDPDVITVQLRDERQDRYNMLFINKFSDYNIEYVFHEEEIQTLQEEDI